MYMYMYISQKLGVCIATVYMYMYIAIEPLRLLHIISFSKPLRLLEIHVSIFLSH